MLSTQEYLGHKKTPKIHASTKAGDRTREGLPFTVDMAVLTYVVLSLRLEPVVVAVASFTPAPDEPAL